MSNAARKEKDVAGSKIRTGRLSVIVNDRPIATQGDIISPHGPGLHTASVIVGYNPNDVYAENRPVACKGDATSCGHSISTGSANVYVGD